MKKLVAALLVVCLLFAGFIGWQQIKNRPQDAATPVQEAETTAAAQAVDLEALYASHAPDEVYALIGDRSMTWAEYYEWLESNILQAEDYINGMAAYGMEVNWNDPFDADTGMSLAEYVVFITNDNLCNMAAVERLAKENNVALTEEELDQIAQLRQAEMEAVLGEDATEEQWEETLRYNFITPRIYDSQLYIRLLHAKGYAKLYGENGELVDDAMALDYLEQNGYVSANHILFLTTDMTTRESLDEETVAAKLEQAEETAAQLQAIADREELINTFLELKQQLDEDTGKVVYPEGYTFTIGQMDSSFDETARELEEYQVSDPVKSFYGYHVILRLPLDPDSVLDYSGETPVTARAMAASEDYNRRLLECIEQTELSYAPGVEPVNLAQVLKSES